MSITRTAPGQLALQGDVGMDSAAAIQAELAPALQGGDISLDLAALGKVDSAAIALLLNALRQQQAKGGKLHLRNVPDSIRVLAQLYELAPLLGLTRTDTP
jgi:phospholipid transport system transporter-binding protein